MIFGNCSVMFCASPPGPSESEDSSLQPPAAARIDTRSVFRGKFLDVREDAVRYPDGSVGKLEVIRHPGAAAAAALYRPGEWAGGTEAAVVLLRQYRHAAGRTLWEIPAGKLAVGEPPEVCALRELEEEAGIRAAKLHRLTTLYTTPGFTDEVIHLFVATGLTQGECSREQHELIETREVALDRALEMVRGGEIVDGKTVCALLMVAAYRDLWSASDAGSDNESRRRGV